MWWALRSTRWGLIVRTTGDSEAAARGLGVSINNVRLAATAVGGFLAGVGGAFLSLSYPGSWNEGLSSGARPHGGGLSHFRSLDPLRCFSPRCCLAPPERLDLRCNQSAFPKGITSSTRALHPYARSHDHFFRIKSAFRDAPGELAINR